MLFFNKYFSIFKKNGVENICKPVIQIFLCNFLQATYVKSFEKYE